MSSRPDPALIRRLWGGDDLAPLWSLARRRLERGAGIGTAPLVLRDPSEATRSAVASLLGTRYSTAGDLRVSVVRLEAALAASAAEASVAEVLEVLGPPLRDRRAERSSDEQRWAALWAAAEGHAALLRHPGLMGWFAELRRTGRLRRLNDADDALTTALDVLVALPAEPPTTRARLAVELCGQAHALDQERGRLVADALAHLADQPRPSTDAQRRALWTDMGVEIEPVRSRVSVLGLRPRPVGPLTEAASRWAEGGIPLVVHLGAVTAETWQIAPGIVRVCENPAVLDEAAQALGAGCAPLVCVEGQLSVAAARLLAQLADGGAELAYHGDFGGGGLTIANRVIGRIGATPWQMSALDHARALDAARAEGLELPPLKGPVPDACWDPDLAPRIRACGVEIEEELVVDHLLDDLS
jgi:uncharacterized protein (TIGR02679 family)